MSFTVQLPVAVCAAHRLKVNEADIDLVSDCGAGWVLESNNTHTWTFAEQPIEISEEGLALVRDLKGDLQELEFFMQRPMTEADLPAVTVWVTFCRRTEDPKLAFLGSLLADRNIPSRRNGRSFHAPILQVPEEHLNQAWAILSEDVFGDGQQFDDIEDDDPVFLNR